MTIGKPASVFASAPYIPPDAIFALTAEYLADPFPQKVNLGQGAYRDAEGQPWVLPSVARSRQILNKQGLRHEYLPILGLAELREGAAELALGGGGYAERSDKVCIIYSSVFLGVKLIRVARNMPDTIRNRRPPPCRPNHQNLSTILTTTKRVHPKPNMVKPPSSLLEARLPMPIIPVLRPRVQNARYRLLPRHAQYRGAGLYYYLACLCA